jgi:hypothetical protein
MTISMVSPLPFFHGTVLNFVGSITSIITGTLGIVVR